MDLRMVKARTMAQSTAWMADSKLRPGDREGRDQVYSCRGPQAGVEPQHSLFKISDHAPPRASSSYLFQSRSSLPLTSHMSASSRKKNPTGMRWNYGSVALRARLCLLCAGSMLSCLVAAVSGGGGAEGGQWCCPYKQPHAKGCGGEEMLHFSAAVCTSLESACFMRPQQQHQVQQEGALRGPTLA